MCRRDSAQRWRGSARKPRFSGALRNRGRMPRVSHTKRNAAWGEQAAFVVGIRANSLRVQRMIILDLGAILRIAPEPFRCGSAPRCNPFRNHSCLRRGPASPRAKCERRAHRDEHCAAIAKHGPCGALGHRTWQTNGHGHPCASRSRAVETRFCVALHGWKPGPRRAGRKKLRFSLV